MAAMSNAVPKPPYPKAPITEGVMHLTVEGKATPAELQKLVKRFAKDYPQQETLAALSVGINTTGGVTTVQQQPQGYRVKSADQADILLVFADGIAASRLAPYPGWEHLQERSRAAWAEWRDIVAHKTIKRIGIRYINRVDIPIKQSEILDIEAYLRIVPRVPEFSKQPLSGFWVQVTKPTDLPHWSVSVTSNIVSPAPLINHVSVALDIDVFRIEQIPGRDADLWDCVNAARSLKNAIFESCMTDEARRLFA
jgi:uncharacterized protein (TIGR04255 family)